MEDGDRIVAPRLSYDGEIVQAVCAGLAERKDLAIVYGTRVRYLSQRRRRKHFVVSRVVNN